MSTNQRRMYGFFRCTNCNILWESSNVFERGLRDVSRALVGLWRYRGPNVIGLLHCE